MPLMEPEDAIGDRKNRNGIFDPFDGSTKAEEDSGFGAGGRNGQPARGTFEKK